MNFTRYLRTLLVTLALIGAFGPGNALGATNTGDSLYVGDSSDSTVKRFNAQTGEYLGAFVALGSGGLVAPVGILHEGNFLVSNTILGEDAFGSINQYASKDGKFLRALVPMVPTPAPGEPSNPKAVYDPHGIIRGPDNHTLYVADIGRESIGAVKTYDVNTGRFLGDLDFSSFISSSSNPTGEFHPRGLVFGPDGLLYVSLFSEVSFPSLSGFILTFSLGTGAVNVFASYNLGATDCSQYLHRPDGLTFGPDGNLYTMSFRADASDTDKILIFSKTGACLHKIDLYQLGQPRAYGQALLFGSGGSLFVPITGGDGSTTGEVRRYNVGTKAYTSFVLPQAQGGPIGNGWYLTFGQTNPMTLAYGK